MTPYEYVSKKIFTKLKPSSISGIGVFALKDIPHDTFLFEPWQGDTGVYPISEEELQTLPKELRFHIKDIFLYGTNFPKDTNTYITLTNNCHWVYTTPYYFVNSGGEKSNIDKETQKSLRHIKSGEEILSNYGRYERIKNPI